MASVSKTHVRTHNCGELRIDDVGSEVVLAGWVHKARDLNHFVFIDLRDRFGITQIVVHEDNAQEYERAKSFGREWVIRVKGLVIERVNKNKNRPTGEIEIKPISTIEILNQSKTPPFTIEEKTDGLEDLRMRYRYLDIRRPPVVENLLFRHKVAMCTRNYLSSQGFVEVETPCLIKSTPEGARDFVVPSRMNQGCFYALPQSPQTFKQLLMISGLDRYFQIVKCFRDEELRSDRQPEFTQIDCEMSFVTQEDVMNTFEAFVKRLFAETKGMDLTEPFKRITYAEVMRDYGSDKPDLRFGMKFHELNSVAKGKGMKLFDDAELVVGICATGLAGESRKKLNALVSLAKSPEIGAGGLVWMKHEKGKGNAEESYKSTVDKFFTPEDLKAWGEACGSKAGDLILVMAGDDEKTRIAMGRFRLAVAKMYDLIKPGVYEILWVVDFPLLEWDEEEERFTAMHHPFTQPFEEDLALLDNDPGRVRALAYDLVINGSEVGGGSIRIHDREMQMKMLKYLGFTPEDAEAQFGFLMRAFEYGAPPHGGIAFGLDRICAVLSGADTIRDFIAFPKNKEGRDTMIDAPSSISDKQLEELNINVVPKKAKELSEGGESNTGSG